MADDKAIMKTLESYDQQMDAASTAKKVAEELTLVCPPQAQCMDMLIPAPLAITLIGKLQLISNNNDFNLREPKDGFKYIRWGSFRASFAQVAHTVQNAFRLSDKHMNAIYLRSSQLPKSFERAVMLIMKQAPYDALSIPLQQIKNDTELCLKMTQEVEKEYALVTNMTVELLEATLAKEKDTQDELKRIERTRDALNEIEKTAQIEKQNNEKRLEELKKNAKEANDMFKKTFEESDGLVMKHAILESVTGLLKSASSTVIPVLMCRNATMSQALVAGVGIGKEALQQSAELKQGQDVEMFEEITENERQDAKRQVAKMEAFGKSKDVLKLASDLMAFVNEDGTISDEAMHDSQEASLVEYFQKLKRSLSELAKSSKNAQRLLDLCAKGFTICSNIKKLREQPGSVEDKELIKDIKKLYENCKEFDTKAQCCLGCTCVDNATPGKTKKKPVSLGQMHAAVEHAHFKLEQSLSYLKHKEQQVDEVEEQRKQLLDEIAARAQQIQNLNVEDVDYRNVRTCLLQGLDVLSRLREQWEYLVRFFQNMSSMLDLALTTSQSFSMYSQQQVKAPEHSYVREIIYQEAFEAMKIGVIVRQLSGCYSEMSQKYLMPQVGALDRLFVAREPSELAAADNELQYQRAIAETGMKEIIDKGRQEICIAINNRRTELKKIKDSLEPSMSSEAIVENQRSVQSAFETVTEEDDEDEASRFTL